MSTCPQAGSLVLLGKGRDPDLRVTNGPNSNTNTARAYLKPSSAKIAPDTPARLKPTHCATPSAKPKPALCFNRSGRGQLPGRKSVVRHNNLPAGDCSLGEKFLRASRAYFFNVAGPHAGPDPHQRIYPLDSFLPVAVRRI